MNMEISKLIVVEYSNRQRCFHIESVREMILDGRRMMQGKTNTDFYPIGIFHNDDAARIFLDEVYQLIENSEIELAKF